jgi:SAM-dependent methyltransferase
MENNRFELKRYFTKDLSWGSGYESSKVFEFLMDAREFSKNGVVLDAGSGYRRYEPFFGNSVFLGQEHPIAGVKNKNVTSYEILSDVRKIPLLSSTVDLVLSTSSLEHIEFPTEFFNEAHRVLKPGGRLYVHVPFVFYEHEQPYDFNRPTRYGLESLAVNSGLKVLDISPTQSSTETAGFFLIASIHDDFKDKFGNNFVLKLLRNLIAVTYRIVFMPILLLLKSQVSKSTKFPVGWVAVFEKDGTLPTNSYSSASDFLSKNVLLDDSTTFDGNCITRNES